LKAAGSVFPVRHPSALSLCLRSLRTDPGRFYGPAAGQPLGAGLLIRDCVLAIPAEAEPRYATALGIALVLTHECDIDQSNERFFNDLVLVCPVIPL
jgi:hypothetical protein